VGERLLCHCLISYNWSKCGFIGCSAVTTTFSYVVLVASYGGIYYIFS